MAQGPAKRAGRWQLAVVMALFLAVVWLCYGGALSGAPWLGLAAATVFLGIACVLAPKVAGVRVTIALLAALGGAVCDTLLQVCGLYTVPQASRWVLPAPSAPEWILALWLNFGIVLLDRAVWFARRPWAGALVGLAFGWMIYSGAARRELVEFGGLGGLGPLVVGAVWVVVVPLLYAMAAAVAARGFAPPPGRGEEGREG